MDSELRLYISEDGADAEWLDTLAGYLRAELAELDVADVTALPAGPPPPGSRAAGIVAVGGLLVSLGQAAGGVASVVAAVRAWLRRGDGTARTVRLELGGDVLELAEASRADQDRLIELFVSRHRPADGGPG